MPPVIEKRQLTRFCQIVCDMAMLSYAFFPWVFHAKQNSTVHDANSKRKNRHQENKETRQNHMRYYKKCCECEIKIASWCK